MRVLRIQCIHSDTCSGFPKSFPHGFTGMVSFCDEYSGDRDFYFLCRPHGPAEVASAVRKFHTSVKGLLRDGKIWTWRTDNGSEFKGEAIEGPGGVVAEMVNTKLFSVPNVKNSNPIPERAWGVIERGIRACHAHAEAPECLWAWAARQCRMVYYHLATTIHSPPRSPLEMLHPSSRGAGRLGMGLDNVL